MERCAHIEARFVVAGLLATTRGGQRRRWRRGGRGQLGEVGFDGDIARRDLALIDVEEFEVLLEGEEGFEAIITRQGGDDLGLGRVTPVVSLEYEQATGATAAVTNARVRAHDYLLERRLFRRLSSGEVIDARWTRFSFPSMWQYDVLRGLDHLRGAGVEPEERMAEAVGLVAERQLPDGRWLLDASPRDAFADELEGGPGQLSRWNTLRALRVLHWYSAYLGGTTGTKPGNT